MHALISVILFLGLSGVLIFGVLHVIQELIIRTAPKLTIFSDCATDRDDLDAESDS
jgi:hypothetical protein